KRNNSQRKIHKNRLRRKKEKRKKERRSKSHLVLNRYLEEQRAVIAKQRKQNKQLQMNSKVPAEKNCRRQRRICLISAYSEDYSSSLASSLSYIYVREEM